MLWMVLVAVAVFAADLAAVAAIAGSMVLEQWLGVPHRIILDFIFVLAVCYGVAAWLIGMWIKREMAANQARSKLSRATVTIAAIDAHQTPESVHPL